jgi:hypothetical protein
MGFFDRTSYIRAIFRTLPFGLAALYFGITGLITSEESLPKYSGRVQDVYMGQVFDEVIDKYTKTLQLKIENGEKFKTTITEYINIIKNNIAVGDTIVVWTGKDNNEIYKLVCNNNLLIPYDPTTWVDIFFLVIGIIYSVLAIGYLITTPEDLWGGDKEKMRAWFKKHFG